MLFRRIILLSLVGLCWSTIASASSATFIITPNPVRVREGSTASFRVTLSASPFSPVQIEVGESSGDADLTLVGGSPQIGTLDATNWNTGLTFSVANAQDAEATEGTRLFYVYNASMTAGVETSRDFTVYEDKSTGGPSDPDTQQTVVSNLDTVKQINTTVVQTVFLQTVRPRIAMPGVRPPETPVAPPPGAEPTETSMGSATMLSANQPAAVVNRSSMWNMSVSSSARYAHTTYYDFDHADSSRYGLTFNSNHQWDRWTLDISVPLDLVYFDGELSEHEYWRTGIIAMPRYELLNEDRNGITLNVGATGYYMRTTMKSDDFYNPDHIGFGLMVGAQKTFERFTVSGGVIGQRAWNCDDRDEITDDEHVDAVSAGLNVGVPIGDRIAVNAMATYTHTPDMPDWLDENTGMAGLGVTYIISDAWAMDATVLHDVFNEDESNVEVHMGLSWQF